MLESMTTQAPPRSSPPVGMYTKMGCLYSRRASTMYAPYLRISPYMSRRPPANPRQLAKMISGSPSRFMSPMACAVLNAESGNHTCPAWVSSAICAPSNAGSAGTVFSEVRVSTATAPMGRPPRRARPVTTLRPQSFITSMNEPRSKKCSSISRGSCGRLGGVKPMGRWMVSGMASRAGEENGRGPPRLAGMYDSQRRMELTPRTSSGTMRWLTPLAPITRGPPICALDVYTSRPSTLLRAEAPVRMSGASACWITRWHRRLQYAPMPTERPVTYAMVTVDLYARDVAAAISPLPCRHSTPWPPHTSVRAKRTSPVASSTTRLATTRPLAPSISKSSSVRYRYLKPLAGLCGSCHATRNAALTASSSPMRAPLLALMYTAGRPSATARSKAARYTASSLGDSDPLMCVMSLATRMISRPPGYSSVFRHARQHTMPTSLEPGARSTSTSLPALLCPYGRLDAVGDASSTSSTRRRTP
mmetsp:Transcript_36878/g.91108  ORF Transcript_36878/g.91108 Transcript_36878/m.91108 type:complete len:476 (+) Transcript_36878:152-1579(+)